jgi:hypothetical protein
VLLLDLAKGGALFRPGHHKEQCSFCLRELSKLEYLIAGPDVSICTRCVIRCVEQLRRSRVHGWRRWWDPRPPSVLAKAEESGPYRRARSDCCFCGVAGAAVVLLRAQHARICAPCVRLADDVAREGIVARYEADRS